MFHVMTPYSILYTINDYLVKISHLGGSPNTHFLFLYQHHGGEVSNERTNQLGNRNHQNVSMVCSADNCTYSLC